MLTLMWGVAALWCLAIAAAYLAYKYQKKAQPLEETNAGYNKEELQVITAPKAAGIVRMNLGGPYLLQTFLEVTKAHLLEPHRKDLSGPADSREDFVLTGKFGGIEGTLEFSVLRTKADTMQFSGGSSLESYADEEGFIKYVRNASMSLSSAIADPTQNLRDLYNNLQDAAGIVEVVAESLEDLRIFELSKQGGNYYFSAVEKPLRFMDDELIACSYEPVSVQYKGKVNKRGLVELLPLFVERFGDGKNIVITGPSGSGKTTLVHNIIARAMQMDSSLRVVRLTNTVMERLQDPEVRSALIDFASDGPLAFMYDEAQGAADYVPLFELMEGDKIKNAPVIAALNDHKKAVPAELLRAGRTDIHIVTTPLTAAKATTLKNVLVKRNPTMSFDVESLRMMLNADKGWGNSIPTPPQQIMLCDVYRCLQPKIQADRLEALLTDTAKAN